MILGFLIAILCIILDQATKLIVDNTMYKGQIINIIEDLFYFTKTYNTGAAFSSFSDSTGFLVFLSLVASIIIAVVLFKTANFKTKKVYTISLGLILGGTFGNLIDRFLTSINIYDGVIDFIGVYLGTYRFPIFNLADSFLVIGVILLCIDILFLDDKRKLGEAENEETQN